MDKRMESDCLAQTDDVIRDAAAAMKQECKAADAQATGKLSPRELASVLRKVLLPDDLPDEALEELLNAAPCFDERGLLEYGVFVDWIMDMYAATSEKQEQAKNPKMKSYWTDRPFDVNECTEDVYGVRNFTGPHADIRPLLDYTYHCHYSEERVMLQDRLIEDFCTAGMQQNDLLLPWVIFTAGAMGAGKGHVMEWMKTQGCLPLDQFVIVDPDQIRQAMPEWDAYVKKDPLSAAVKTQKEAGHMAEILGYAALRHRRNVIFDGSLRDSEWYKVYFQKLRYSFPGIRLMILHIQAKREEVLKRAEERGQQTGRMVPADLLESSMAEVPKSVAILAPHVDVAVRVLNYSGQDPIFEPVHGAKNPLEGIPISKEWLACLWRPIDMDGDGSLTKEEVLAALSHGKLTVEVVDTVDTDHDGTISKEELKKAAETCWGSASVKYREPRHAQLVAARTRKWGA